MFYVIFLFKNENIYSETVKYVCRVICQQSYKYLAAHDVPLTQLVFWVTVIFFKVFQLQFLNFLERFHYVLEVVSNFIVFKFVHFAFSLKSVLQFHIFRNRTFQNYRCIYILVKYIHLHCSTFVIHFLM